MEEGIKEIWEEKNIEPKQNRKGLELGTILLIIVVVLLAVNIYLQRPIASKKCREAKNLAADIISLSVEFNSEISDDYDYAVYDHASNINQQIFYSNEFQFNVLSQMNVQQLVILDLLTYCH